MKPSWRGGPERARECVAVAIIRTTFTCLTRTPGNKKKQKTKTKQKQTRNMNYLQKPQREIHGLDLFY